MFIEVCLVIGKGEPKAKQVKLAQKARKPQAAKNGPKKPFPCDQCEASYDRRAKLKNHIDTIHLGLKPYKCTQCDEAFGKNGNLLRHIKSAHENAFVCEQCNKSFAAKDAKERHIALVHEGIKVKCDFCDAMVAKNNIARHKKTHQKD